MKRHIFKAVVFFEVLTIFCLAYIVGHQISERRKNVLGSFSESPVAKSQLNELPDADLKYYRELTPNQKMIDQRSWIKNPITYNINADALNERYDYAAQKSPDVFRIITLGDSFTFGQLVNTAENWSERLEDNLNSSQFCKNNKKFEIINLGMLGYGVEYINHRYELRGKKYNPDLIIWFESESGFERVNELIMPLVEKYRNQMSPEEIKEASESGTFPDWEEGFNEFHRSYSESQVEEAVQASWQKFFEERDKTETLIVTFNNLSQRQNDLLKSWASGWESVEVYDGIPWLDIGGWKFKDGHPNKNGHKMIASHVLDYLKKSSIIVCD